MTESFDTMSTDHASEIRAGNRFEFGQNWSRFLQTINDHRIEMAEQSLRDFLGVSRLEGKSFLDIGSGSGLSSLAARRLGASVRSFDFDPESVACTRELHRRFFREDRNWTIEAGSVLDDSYVQRLGQFDVVYSWGVLHHTGEMWHAIENAMRPVKAGGLLYIAIYNDQGLWSRRWLRIKKLYNRLPRFLRLPYALVVMGARELSYFLPQLIRLRPDRYLRTWLNYSKTSMRGMSMWHDLIDWVGGYPFEVAKPEQIFDFCQARGFELCKFRTNAGGIACNEYVFRRK
jgi:2-polyprenyl-6-hydroxyphenyl methylase/3-demethylubiquinone-9 3-methyltransferase